MTNLIVSMLILAVVVCQTTGQGGEYKQLDPRMKKFVDLAIIKANTIIDPKAGHLNFLASGENYNEVNSHVRIDVRLKNTNCKRSTAANEHRHRPGCKFKKYQVYCIVCSKDPNTSDPYIDCVRKKDAQPACPYCLRPPNFLLERSDFLTCSFPNSKFEYCFSEDASDVIFVVEPDLSDERFGGRRQYEQAFKRYPTWNNICPPHSGPGRRLPGESNPLSSSLNPGGDAVVVEEGNTTGTSLNVTADQENVMKTNASDYEFNYDYEDAVVDKGGDDDTGDTYY